MARAKRTETSKAAAGSSLAAAAELRTIRDVLRYAVTRFNGADIAYGQGTGNAVDEAAFLILESLHLPVDQLEPFLDARLTLAERRLLVGRIAARADDRMPAAYLTGIAYIQGLRLRADARAIVPRSFIGELIAAGRLGADDLGLIPDPDAIGSVLDLCTGSGSLAIIAALAFPNAAIEAVDLSPDALTLAAENIADHGLSDRIRLIAGDLWQPIRRCRYDLIISNPPYVDAIAMALLPPEFRHEPAMALAGGDDGLDLVRRILDRAAAHLSRRGGLLCEIGRGRAALEAAYPSLPFLWLDTEESEGEVFWIGRNDLPSAPQKAAKAGG